MFVKFKDANGVPFYIIPGQITQISQMGNSADMSHIQGVGVSAVVVGRPDDIAAFIGNLPHPPQIAWPNKQWAFVQPPPKPADVFVIHHKRMGYLADPARGRSVDGWVDGVDAAHKFGTQAEAEGVAGSDAMPGGCTTHALSDLLPAKPDAAYNGGPEHER